MVNRFATPDEQFFDDDGAVLAGGFLYFFETGSSTPLATYNDPDLDISHANTNPVELDSAGRAGPIFLQTLAYKAVLKDSDLNQIWTADPVYSSDYSTVAQFQTYAGNPNGNVAGTAGSGAILSSVVWDRSNNLLYVCTTTGSAMTAVWTQVAASLVGAIIMSSTITPTSLAADTNNWAPTSFASAYQIRVSSSAAYALTGIAGGAAGREILLSNIGSFDIALTGNSGSSSVGNKFLMNDMVLGAGLSVCLHYDGTSAGWRQKSTTAAGKQTIFVPAGSMTSRTTNGAASGSLEMATAKNMFITKDFDTTTQEFVQFFVAMPKSYNLATVTFIPYWSHAAAVTNFGIVLGLAAVGVGNDDPGDVAFGTAVTSTDTGGTTNDIYVGPESAAITIASVAQGDLIWFQLNRTVGDAADTLAVDCRVHGVKVIFSTDNTNDA